MARQARLQQPPVAAIRPLGGRDRLPGAGGDRQPCLRQVALSARRGRRRGQGNPGTGADPRHHHQPRIRCHSDALAAPEPQRIRIARQAAGFRRRPGGCSPPAGTGGGGGLGRLRQDRRHAGQDAGRRGPCVVRHAIGVPRTIRARAVRRPRLRESGAGGGLSELPGVCRDPACASRARGHLPGFSGLVRAPAPEPGCAQRPWRPGCPRPVRRVSRRDQRRRAGATGLAGLPGAGSAPVAAGRAGARSGPWPVWPLPVLADRDQPVRSEPGGPRMAVAGASAVRLRGGRRSAGPDQCAIGTGAGLPETTRAVPAVRRLEPDRAPELLLLGVGARTVLAWPAGPCSSRRTVTPAAPGTDAVGAAGQLPQHTQCDRAGQRLAQGQAGAIWIDRPREQFPGAMRVRPRRVGGTFAGPRARAARTQPAHPCLGATRGGGLARRRQTRRPGTLLHPAVVFRARGQRPGIPACDSVRAGVGPTRGVCRGLPGCHSGRPAGRTARLPPRARQGRQVAGAVQVLCQRFVRGHDTRGREPGAGGVRHRPSAARPAGPASSGREDARLGTGANVLARGLGARGAQTGVAGQGRAGPCDPRHLPAAPASAVDTLVRGRPARYAAARLGQGAGLQQATSGTAGLRALARPACLGAATGDQGAVPTGPQPGSRQRSGGVAGVCLQPRVPARPVGAR